MEDLGAALAGDRDIAMLGGGNPAHIPELEALFSEELHRILADEREYRRMFANYPSPAGEERFRSALAALLHREYGWPLSARNIALTSGSQTGFFTLFNLLAGRHPDGSFKQVLLPLTPEYIGYQDVGLSPGMITSARPSIELRDEHYFKYHLDLANLEVSRDTAAICVSRPTNPTGNVLTDDEMRSLMRIAREAGVPLLIDNAYGLPFPNIVFSDARPVWDDNVVLCLSMSKLGLPGIRTGVVVAAEAVIDAVTGVNSVLSLAVPSVGAVLLHELVTSGRLLDISQAVIQPYYRRKMEQAVGWVHQYLAGLDYRIHVPEGALFLWLWLPGLRGGSEQLYARLKARDVLVLSGHHFFPGLKGEWEHRHECIRLTYSQDPASVERGIKALADEARQLRE